MILESLPAPARTALLLGAPLKLEFLKAGLCLVGAVDFVFRNG